MSFRDEYGKAVQGGLVLYTGAEVFWLSEGVLAVPGGVWSDGGAPGTTCPIEVGRAGISPTFLD